MWDLKILLASQINIWINFIKIQLNVYTMFHHLWIKCGNEFRSVWAFLISVNYYFFLDNIFSIDMLSPPWRLYLSDLKTLLQVEILVNYIDSIWINASFGGKQVHVHYETKIPELIEYWWEVFYYLKKTCSRECLL